MKFEAGNKVMVSIKGSVYKDMVAEIHTVTGDGTYMVRFPEIEHVRGFFESELEPFDEKAEALIELAEILNTARLHIYNSETLTNGSMERRTNEALMEVIESYYSHQGLRNTAWIAGRTFSEVIHGKSVREAIAAVEK